MKKFLSLCLAGIMSLGLLAGCASGETGGADSGGESGGTDDGKYRIALSNSYLGNDWRQQMIKAAVAASEKEPYASQVELTIVNSENTAEAQSASIDALVEQDYDAILIDAASTTALNASILRAMEAGVVCVTFDSVAVVDGIYTVTTDFTAMAEGWANYLVAKLEPGDKIAVDTGLPGSSVGNTMYDTAMAIFAENGIEVVAEFAGEFADGVGQQQIASILAANPELDGIYTQVYGETIQKAFEAAGRDYIPSVAYTTNAGSLAALDHDMELLTAVNWAGQSVFAMDIALRVLNGEEVEESMIYLPEFYSTDDTVDIGYPVIKMEEDVNCWRDIPGGLMLPNLPGDYAIQVSAQEVADYNQ